MKIFLLGDMSGVHKNLKMGLNYCGYKNVNLATAGDGFKQIMGDLKHPFLKNYSVFDKFKFRLDFYNFLSEIKGYDIVQFAGPFILPFPYFPYKKIFNKLKENNGKIVYVPVVLMLIFGPILIRYCNLDLNNYLKLLNTT